MSESAALEAYERRGQFNVVMLDSGWKADLILCRKRAFSRSEFGRRQPAEIAEIRVFVATVKDTVIARLEWARLGEFERQLRDVAGILELREGALDLEYIEEWVHELGVAEEWDRVRRGAQTRLIKSRRVRSAREVESGTP